MRSLLSKAGMLIAVAVMFFFGLVGTVYMSLRSSEVKVPNVVGMSRFDAEKALERSGLNLRKRADRFNPKEKPDTVLDQSPRAGDTVKSGQTIAVIVSRVQAREGEAAMNVNEGAENANNSNAASETKSTNNAKENSENANNSNNANNTNKPKKKKSKNENVNNNNSGGASLLDDTGLNANNTNRNSANRNKANANANAANRNSNAPNANNANRNATNANRNATNTNSPAGGANVNRNSNTNTTRVPLVLPPPVSPGVKP